MLKGKFPRSRFFDIQDSAPFDPHYPAGPSVGAPEVPIVDADIRPDRCNVNPFRVFSQGAGRPHGCAGAGASSRGCARLRDGERRVPNRCRNYTVTYRHRMGDYIKLNNAVNPGFANETDSSPLRAPKGRNVRVAGGLRDGGGITLGKLLPAQIWIRYYLPNRRAGVYGGVPLPRVHFQLKTGEKYVIQPVRGPALAGTGHDQFLRRLNGPYPAKAFKPQRTYEPTTTGWTSDVGWHKVFGIARAIYEDVAIGGLGPIPFAAPITAPFTRDYIRTIDSRSYGRGPDEGSVGGFEQSATSCDYCHYMGRHMVIGKGSVAVLTAKLPITPKTYAGQSRMKGGELRYFSISHYVNGPNQDDITNLVLPAGNFGSLSDEDLITKKSGPAKGWYTVVYSRNDDRPANATAANGVSWQDWSDHTEQTMTLRWLEVGPEWSSPWAPNFRHLPFKTADWAAPDWDPKLTFNNDRARSYMGDHQIEIHYMSKQAFEALGSNIDPMNVPHRDDWTGPLSPGNGVGPVSPPPAP